MLTERVLVGGMIRIVGRAYARKERPWRLKLGLW
jgi:hypothetical protein